MIWADYYRERLGGEVIVNGDISFAAYRISGQECYLEEMYISPKHRGTGECKRLVSQVNDAGKSKGCNRLTTTVVSGTNGAEVSLMAAVSSGFKLVGANAGVVYFAKEIV